MENVTADLAHHSDKTYSSRKLEDIDTIVVHQTDSRDKGDLHPFRTASYHVNSKGWPGIAYHFFVIDGGKVFQTNELETISYHARSSNPNSVGIVISGKHRYDPSKTNTEIIDKKKYYSLVKAIASIKRKLPRKDIDIVSHDSLSDQRSDPNLDMDELRKDVKYYEIARKVAWSILVLCIVGLLYKYRSVFTKR